MYMYTSVLTMPFCGDAAQPVPLSAPPVNRGYKEWVVPPV